MDSLDNAAILKENLDELQQTVMLMQTENPDEFYDISIRNKKFGRVDAMNGPRILEKYVLLCLIVLPCYCAETDVEPVGRCVQLNRDG